MPRSTFTTRILDPLETAADWREALGIGTYGHVGYRSGAYYWAGQGQIAGLTFAVSANVLYAVPIFIRTSVTLAALVCSVTTGSAGAVRVGIYADNSNGYPGALVVDAGTADTTGIADLEVATSQVLVPGLYWVVAVFNATPTMRRLSGAAISAFLFFPSPTAGATTLGETPNVSVSFTYGVLPSTFIGGGTYIDSASCPRFAIKPA